MEIDHEKQKQAKVVSLNGKVIVIVRTNQEKYDSYLLIPKYGDRYELEDRLKCESSKTFCQDIHCR